MGPRVWGGSLYFQQRRQSGKLKGDDKGKSPSFWRKIDRQTLQGQTVEKLKLLCHAPAAAEQQCSAVQPEPALFSWESDGARLYQLRPDKSENMKIGREVFTVRVVKELNQHFGNLGVSFLSGKNSKSTFYWCSDTPIQVTKKKRLQPFCLNLNLDGSEYFHFYFCVCVCNLS